MTQPLKPDCTWTTDTPLHLFEPLRRILMPDNVIFYLDDLVFEGTHLTRLQLYFSLRDGGNLLVYEGVDDPVYFSQFDAEHWVQVAAKTLLTGAHDCLGVYIQGQLSGPPRARLVTQECLDRLYPEMRVDETSLA